MRDPRYRLPTRVLDVSGKNLRLQELDLTDTPYVALSHCWGNTATIMSTESNLSAYENKIRESDLPAAFLDAVTVTQKLGISYLWIDSLCIIQDSLGDWLRECPKMGAYYRNAYFTISALESPDSTHSFLSSKKPQDTFRWPGKDGFWIRPRLSAPSSIFQAAALNHRGWALQERLLSTCVLHFTHQEIFWECQTCSARESSRVESHGLANFHSLVSLEGEDFKRALCSLHPDRFSNSNGAFAVWMRLVRQFSRRSLTFVSDRLPAISGLAATLAAQTKSKYMAGLWQDDLHGLAWFRDGPADRISHRPKVDEKNLDDAINEKIQQRTSEEIGGGEEATPKSFDAKIEEGCPLASGTPRKEPLVVVFEGELSFKENTTFRSEELPQTDYIGPSWSWISMDDSITYRFNEEARVASAQDPRLMEVDIQMQSLDLYGSISSGSIVLKALAKPVLCYSHYDIPEGWTRHDITFDPLPENIFHRRWCLCGHGVL